MSFSKAIADLIARLTGSKTPPNSTPNQTALTARDRAFIEKMLAGVTAQVVHERGLGEARTAPRTTVRLVPQVPVEDRNGGDAWLGGGARLAPGMDWPVIEGTRLQLLAQFNCAKLPADLWDGLGPRRGWLALFVHPETLQPKVLHFATAGEFKPSPPIGPDCNMIGYDGRKAAEACGYTGVFPRWPATLETAATSEGAPRGPHGGSLSHIRYAQRHDFVADGRWPFDWASAAKMIEIAIDELERIVPASEAPGAWFTPEAIVKSAQGIAAAKASGADAETIAGLEVRLGEMVVTAAVHDYRVRHGAGVLAALRALKMRIADVASRQSFSEATIGEVLTQLQSMQWMHKRTPPFYRDGIKLSEVQRAAEGCEAFLLPLTTHDSAAAPTWVHAFETHLLEAARPVYLDDPAALPARLRADCEEMWASRAAESAGGIGHVPWRYVHEFDDGEDVTLLELPSSDLIGWQWGDVDNIVITMKRKALARGDFSRARVQITN